MQCLHKLPAVSSGIGWRCNQEPSCNFTCYENERYLYESGIFDFEKTNQPQPKCCSDNLAKLLIVKDPEKPNYRRPFFVCSKDENRCPYFEWADAIIPLRPYCFHNETCKSWTVKKEGPNKGRKFFRCPRQLYADGGCNFFQWAAVEEEKNMTPLNYRCSSLRF